MSAVEEHDRVERQALAQAQSAARIVGLYIPLALTAIGAAVFLVWMPRLPNPMAVHWNGAGMPDGFDSPWVSFVGFSVVSLVITSMYFLQHLQMWQAQQKPGAPIWGAMNRLLPAIVLATVTLIFVMNLGTTVPQLDIADARELGHANVALYGSFAAAIVVGLIAFFVQPKLQIAPRVDADAGQPLDLADTERAVWLGTAAASKAYCWVIGVTIACMFATTILLVPMRPFGWTPVIIMVVTTVFVTVLGLMCARFTVRIDDEGLTARALTGWPTYRVPAADVAKVDVGEIAPFAEFGGWGLRFVGGGSVGIVLRTGPGIRISQKSGKKLTITLDDAETAASVLAAAAERSK